MIFVQVIFILILPFLLFKLQGYNKVFKPILMAYVLGVLIGNVKPELFNAGLIHELVGISIVLAIPLLLFPTRLKALIHQPKTMLLAYGLAIIGTTVANLISFSLFKDTLESAPMVAGCVEGVYTGGTVNLNAIAIAFDLPEGLMVLMNGYDMGLSGIYLLGIFTILPVVLSKILPANEVMKNEKVDELELGQKMAWQNVLKSVGLAVLVLGVVAGSSIVFLGSMNEMWIIFGVTLGSIALSGIKRIRTIETHMLVADYFMLIFGFTLGLQANLQELFADPSALMYYFMVTYILMLMIHLGLSKIFKIDVNTFLISSTAAIFGPPFIGPVAESLKDRSLITPGIIVALLGNAIGTFVGVGMVYLLMN